MTCNLSEEIELRNKVLAENNLIGRSLTDDLFELTKDSDVNNLSIPLFTSFIDDKEVLDKDNSNILRKALQKQLNIGYDAKQWLDNYSDLKVVAKESNFGSIYNKINNYVQKETQYVVYGTNIETNQEEALFTFPNKNDNFLLSFTLLNKIVNHLKNIGSNSFNVSKQVLKNWITSHYENRNITVNYPALSEKEGNVFSYKQLKESYGDLYDFKFSSPVVLVNPDIANINPELKGRTVLFYNKFPDKNRTVDYILKHYNSTGRFDDSIKLGMIVLSNNKPFTSIKEMIAMLSEHSIVKDTNGNSLDFFAYDYQSLKLEQLLENTIKSELRYYLGKYNGSLIKRLVEIYNERSNSSATFFSALDKVFKADMEKENSFFKNGIYVNPKIQTNSTDFNSPVSFVDLSNDVVKKYFEKAFQITNLNEDLIGLPNIMIKPNITELDNEFELFITPDIEENYNVNENNEENFVYDYNSLSSLGTSYHGNLVELINYFNKYEVSVIDLKNFLKQNLLNSVIFNDKINITQSINNSFNSKIKC